MLFDVSIAAKEQLTQGWSATDKTSKSKQEGVPFGHLDMGEAFIRLRDHAHATDQPLTDLARRLVTREAGTEVLDQTGPG